MIQEVWADFAKFKRVIFHPGFNVVTAEKTQDSKEKDSRNGLGKSSLIEIIHFLLGSSAIPNAKGSPIEEWTFFGSFKIEGFDYVVSRSLKTPGAVRIESGDTREFEVAVMLSPAITLAASSMLRFGRESLATFAFNCRQMLRSIRPPFEV